MSNLYEMSRDMVKAYLDGYFDGMRSDEYGYRNEFYIQDPRYKLYDDGYYDAKGTGVGEW